MKLRSVFMMFLFCFVLCPAMATPVSAENLLDVIEAAQTVILKNYSNRDSIARKMALEEREKIARSGQPDVRIIRDILDKFPDASDELFAKSDRNSNGIPDEWEKEHNISDGFTAPESDEDADGFTLIQEYKAKTDPVDPLSHPKYITQIYVSAVSRQRFAGLELVSVDKIRYDRRNWVATFNVIRNGKKRVEFVRIGNTFRNNDVVFSVVDIVMNEKTQKPVVCLSRVGRDERIPCQSGQPVRDPLPRVRFLNSLNAGMFVSQVAGTFKLGSEKTGEETYRIVSADVDTKIIIVESVGEMSETFKIPPVPGDLPAAKAIAVAKAAATVTAAATAKAAATARAVATAKAAATATVPAKDDAKSAEKKKKATPLPIFYKRDTQKGY